MIRQAIVRSVVMSALLCVAAVTNAAGQNYPSRLIKLIVPGPPGGPSEIVVRTLAERLSSSLHQTVIVENRPGGANGTIGAMSVARAEPDGYTLLYTIPGPMVVAPAVYKNLDYDPVKSFAPVATIFSSPQMLTVNPAVPAKTIQELIAYAKANPGKISRSEEHTSESSHSS